MYQHIKTINLSNHLISLPQTVENSNEVYKMIKDLNWYLIYHKVTNNIYSLENQYALLFIDENEAIEYIDSEDMNDYLSFRPFTIFEKRIEYLYRLGFKGIEVYIDNEKTAIALDDLESVSFKEIKTFPIINDFLLLSQYISKGDFDYSNFRTMETKTFNDLTNMKFYLKYAVFEDKEFLEQLIDKTNKTVWVSCYTDIPDLGNKWQFKSLDFSTILFYVNNCNGIAINPYKENIKVNNKVILSFKMYNVRQRAINVIFANKHTKEIAYHQDRNTMTLLYKTFIAYDQIKVVRILGLEANDKSEDNLIFILELSNGNEIDIERLNKKLQSLFTEKVYLLKSWDMDKMYLKGAMIIFDRFS